MVTREKCNVCDAYAYAYTQEKLTDSLTFEIRRHLRMEHKMEFLLTEIRAVLDWFVAENSCPCSCHWENKVCLACNIIVCRFCEQMGDIRG